MLSANTVIAADGVSMRPNSTTSPGSSAGTENPSMLRWQAVIDPVAEKVDEKQKSATRAILCNPAMADGVPAGEEKTILRVYMDKFGIPEAKLQPIIEADAIKNDFSLFF